MLFRKEYAILSHTWKGREVTYATAREVLADYKAPSTPRTTSADPGVTKLRRAIEKAKELGYTYLWVDNCCIDKPNNTELVEAISSMGDWYENAAICLIYLDDFLGDKITSRTPLDTCKTRWATRGWTLQEVVMSKHAVFYNKSWNIVADTRKRDAPRDVLALVCHVPKDMLCCGGKPDVAASIVLKLAAQRKTFKPEDRAYSLMGILGVRMRADYGEGRARAISRLFEAIIRTTGDVSIFNW
ncbi:heterokaryon incompatibility protein-domain-containing protein, partial [Pyronema domesticum]